MPLYTIRDPQSGKTIKLRGDAPPSKEVLDQVFAKVRSLPDTKTQPKEDPEAKVDTYAAPIKQKVPDDLPPPVMSQAELDAYHEAEDKKNNQFRQFFANMGKQAVELLGTREDAKQVVRASAQNIAASGAAGAEAVGRMAAAPVTGDTFSDIADGMQANIEQWGYAPPREGTRKALEKVGKALEPIDSATFRAGSIFEDVPVIGPTLATATKVGLDTAIGALTGKYVMKGMQMAKARQAAKATIKAERAATAVRNAEANHYFQKKVAWEKGRMLEDETPVDTTGVLKSKDAFVKEYMKESKGSVTASELDAKWEDYMKSAIKEEDAYVDAQMQNLNKPRPKPIDVEPIELPPQVKHTRKGKMADGFGEFFGSVITRLDSIDPSKTLSSSVRLMEHNIEKKMVFRNALLDDFYRISDRMYKSKLSDNWHKAYLEQDWNELKNLAIAEQVKPSRLRTFNGDYDRIFNGVRDVLNEMGNEALDSGFRGFGLIKDYLPRHMNEDKLAALANLDDQFATALGPNKIDKLAKAMNKTYDDYSTRMEAINGALMSGGESKIPAVVAKQAKRRKQELLPLQYYEPGHVAIKRYVNDMTESIEMRKFLGRNKANLDDSLGAFVDQQGELMKLNQREVNVLKGVLEARFKEGRMHTPKFLQGVKNFGYITSIGNVWSTITQVGDILSSMRTLGVRNTIGGLTDIVRGKGLKTAEVGYEQIMKELADTSKSSEWLDRALIVSGFKAMDQFGKRTIVNASRRKYRKLALTTKGRKRIAEDYGWLNKKSPEEYTQFLEDLAKGDISNDNVKLAIFNDLADLQPITLSDMPLSYLRNPKGRVLWALKTWQSQQLNTLYRQTVQEFKRGNKARAMSNFTKFVTFNVILGTAGVDTFKDWLAKAMAGEDITQQDISDNVTDAFLRTAFVSRYAIDKSQGPQDFWYFASQAAAPSLSGTINRITRAAKKEGAESKMKELFKIVPIVGAPYGAYERAKEGK